MKLFGLDQGHRSDCHVDRAAEPTIAAVSSAQYVPQAAVSNRSKVLRYSITSARASRYFKDKRLLRLSRSAPTTLTILPRRSSVPDHSSRSPVRFRSSWKWQREPWVHRKPGTHPDQVVRTKKALQIADLRLEREPAAPAK